MRLPLSCVLVLQPRDRPSHTVEKSHNNAFNSGNKSFHRLRAPSRSPMLMLHRCIALLAACYLVKSYCDAMHTFFDVVARSTSLVITDNAAAQNN